MMGMPDSPPRGLSCDVVGVAHADVLAALHREALAEGPDWTCEDFASFLALPNVLALLAVRDPDPVGFALAQAAGPEADLVLIGVAERFRRAGAGSVLMEALHARLESAGVKEIFLDVAEDNGTALAFYKALGFQEIGRRKGYYDRTRRRSDPGEQVATGRTDAILMKRSWI